MITCPSCGTENLLNTVFCVECGHNLLETVGGRQHGKSASRLCLVSAVSDQKLEIEIAHDRGMTLGRRDPQGAFRPDVDLAEFDAVAYGVSRKHAKIFVENGQWFIQDLDSTNGTRVGKRRLSPHQRCLLRQRERIELGHLVLYIEFLQ